MSRDELIAAAMDAAQSIPLPSRPLFDDDDERGAIAVLDAVEPLIRADEQGMGREALIELTRRGARVNLLADLRAKVEALLNESTGTHDFLLGKRFACQSVLDLIDGAS